MTCTYFKGRILYVGIINIPSAKVIQDWPLCVDLTCRPRCTRCCCQLSSVGLFLCCHFWIYTHTHIYKYLRNGHDNDVRHKRQATAAARRHCDIIHVCICPVLCALCFWGNQITTDTPTNCTNTERVTSLSPPRPAHHSMGALGQTRTNDRLAILSQLCG